jgi:hypothetical protein
LWRAIIALALLAPAARADEACRDARRSYHEALAGLSEALRAYGQCLSLGRGEDDCAVAFVDVESAQRDIETAVAAIRQSCDGTGR